MFKLFLPIISIVAIWQPFYGLFTYIFFNIIRPEMLFWGGAGTGALVFKVAVVSTIIGYFRLPAGAVKPTACREFWLLGWVSCAVVVSLCLSDIPLERRAWYYAFEVGKYWVLTWLVLGIVTNRESVLRIQNWILYSVTFMAMWGVEQSLRGNERLEGLAGGSAADSNGIAAIGVLFFSISLNKFIVAKDYKERVVSFFITGAIIALIILTQSRGGFVGLLCAIVILGLTTRKKAVFVFLIATSVIFASPYITGKYKERMSSIVGVNEERDYSSASRLVLWQAGGRIFLDNPFFGVGLLNYPMAKMQYQRSLGGNIDLDLLEYSFQRYKVGHSTYLGQILPEGGLFLAIPCFLLFWYVMVGYLKIKRVLNLKQEGNDPLLDLLTGIIAGIVGHIVCLVFINGLYMMFLPLQLTFAGQIIRILQNGIDERYSAQ